MKIENPNAIYWPQTNMYEHIANIASVCYHSPKKEGEKAKKMVEALIRSNHISPTRHASMYFIVPQGCNDGLLFGQLSNYKNNPYVDIVYNRNFSIEPFCWISTNYNFILDHEEFADKVFPYQVTPEEFMKEAPELMRFTFCLTTQISTSREINRKSPNCIMEESSRYILYAEDGKAEPAICRPHWLDANIVQEYPTGDFRTLDSKGRELTELEKLNVLEYLQSCELSFKTYTRLVKNGMKQEDARGVLPTDTKTTVIYTYSVKEWSDIFKLRYLDMTGKSHPNCKVIMGLVLKEFNKLGYELSDKGDLIYRKKFNV